MGGVQARDRRGCVLLVKKAARGAGFPDASRREDEALWWERFFWGCVTVFVTVGGTVVSVTVFVTVGCTVVCVTVCLSV